MEIKLNTVQVIKAKDDFAFLEEVTPDNYRYKFNFSISKSAAKESSALQVHLRFYKQNPKNVPQLSIFKSQGGSGVLNVLGLDGAKLVGDIQRRGAGATDSILAARKNYFDSRISSVDYLTTTFNQGIGYSDQASIPEEYKQAVRNDVYTSARPILGSDLNDDRTVSQLSSELLMDYKIDPAQAIRRVYSVDTPSEGNNGASSIGLYSETISREEPSIQSHLLGHLLAANPVGAASTDTDLVAYSLDKLDSIDVYIEHSVARVLVNNDDFWIMVSVYDTNNMLIQEFVKYVEHRKYLSFYSQVVLPPLFNLFENGPGSFDLLIEQRDPNATGVKLYRTIFAGTSGFSQVEQEYLGSYDVVFGEQKRLSLQVNTFGTILFRALSYNNSGNDQSDFSSQIVQATNAFSEDTDKLQGQFLTLQAKYEGNGVELIIKQIPDSIAFVRIYKTNLSVNPDLETLLTTFNVGGLASNAAWCYTDTNLDKNKYYSYRCGLVDIKGQEYDCPTEVEFCYLPVEQNYAAVTISTPTTKAVQQTSSNTQMYDVSFNIGYAPNKTLEDKLREFLRNQNLIEYYNSVIDPETLGRLLVTKVELRNLDTNDKSFMAFTDKEYKQSVVPYGLLSPNTRYVYELTTYVRSPQTLLAEFTKTVTPTIRRNPPYTYKPSVFNNPYGLLIGTLPRENGSEFATMTGLDQLELAAVVSIDYVEIDLHKPRASLNALRAFLFNSKTIQLTWSVNGDQGAVSHFIIRRINVDTGKLDVVGKAHGISVQNSFSFIDPMRYTERGVFRYIITMQYFDMTLSSDYTSNEVVL